MAPRSNITEDMYKQISEEYANGASRKALRFKYHIGYPVIERALTKYNVPIRNDLLRGPNNYGLNKSYFNTIDTSNKAWCFGYLYADGSANKNKRCIEITSIDKDALEKLIKEMYTGQKPLEVISKDKKVNAIHDQYRLSIHSREMWEDVVSMGLIPNKSLILQPPTGIPTNLYSHFWRGYYDGNGSLSYSLKDNAYTRDCSITSSVDFCEYTRKFFKNTLDIDMTVQYITNKHQYARVSINSLYDMMDFLDYIYKDAELFIDRKYEAYLNFKIFMNNRRSNGRLN